MNYDQPRQLQKGGWHYTRRNDDTIWPLGYCRDHDPHETEDEARRCYQDYLLAERLAFHPISPELKVIHLCEVMECSNPATRNAVLDGWWGHRLCEKHATPAVVRTIVGDVAGDSMHS